MVFCNRTPDSRLKHAGMTTFYTFARASFKLILNLLDKPIGDGL
jgi:hypothetical protein